MKLSYCRSSQASDGRAAIAVKDACLTKGSFKRDSSTGPAQKFPAGRAFRPRNPDDQAKRIRDLLIKLARFVAVIATVVGCLAIFVPVAPKFPTTTLDDSWMYALNAAVAKGLVFGGDVIFTFGPYASAYTRQYYPATDAQMLWSSALLALSLAVGLVVLARDHLKLSALLLVPYLALVSADQIFFCIPLVFLLLVCRIALPSTHPASLSATNSSYGSLILLIIALSLLPLVKGTFGVAAALASAFGWAVFIIRGKTMLAMSGALIFVLGIAAFWMIAGQSIANLPSFFIAQGAIVSGYTEAMSSEGHAREVIIFLAGCCLLGVSHIDFLRSGGLPAIMLAGGIAVLLFLAFKAGFVRHDAHALVAAGVLGLVGWVMMIGLPGIRPIVGFAICLVCWGAIDHYYESVSIAELADRIAKPFLDSANGLVDRVEGNGALHEQFEESQAAIRAEQPAPPLKGSTDVYAFGQSILLAHGLGWAPRPVLQSYSAYTPALLDRDAAHLVGPEAPDNILFSVQPIDNRLAALDDSLSWPALLTRYEPSALVGDMAVLQRRPEPTTNQVLRDAPLASGTYRFGEEIPLPSTTAALWAKIEAKQTLLGKLVALAYKPPPLEIEFRMDDGRTKRFRYIAKIGEAGFVASPLVQDTRDFLALELPSNIGYFTASRPRSMSLFVVGGALAGKMWETNFTVRITEMNIPAQAQVGALLFRQSFAKTPADTQIAELPDTTDCWIDRINRQAVDKTPMTIRGALSVEGWAAMSLADGIAPDETRITLEAENGEVDTMSATLFPRGDVNQIFKRPKMGNVGFRAFANISNFDGRYTLGVRMSANGKIRNCAMRAHLLIEAIKPDRS